MYLIHFKSPLTNCWIKDPDNYCINFGKPSFANEILLQDINRPQKVYFKL